MSGALTPRAADDESSWQDDAAIDGSDKLVRFIINGLHVTKNGSGGYKISSQAFTNSPGISVELERLYDAAKEAVQSRASAHDAMGAARVTAASVRATALKYHPKTRAPEGDERLGVVYTPDQAGGRNDFHCDIFPGPPRDQATSKELYKASTEAMPLDQVVAELRYKQARGLA